MLLHECGSCARGVFVQTNTIEYGAVLHQRPQQISKSFAKAGFLVLYLTRGDFDGGYKQVFPGLFLAKEYEGEEDAFGPVQHIRGAIFSFYSTVTTYDFATDLQQLRKQGNFLIFEYVDEIDDLISGGNTDLLLRNFKFLDQFNLFLASARQLKRDLAQTRDVGVENTVYVPNAVDFDFVNKHKHHAFPGWRREYFDNLSKPVVGYFGAIAPWLWYHLINQVSATSPEYDFVFIGPDLGFGLSHLNFSSNVHYLGAVNHQELPYYASRFDVAFIPFAPGPVAATTSPLKLFEYFALEKPVVTTSEMVECVQYDVVFHASSPEGIKYKIAEAMKRRDDQFYISRLGELARENTWDARVLSIIQEYEKRKRPPSNLSFVITFGICSLFLLVALTVTRKDIVVRSNKRSNTARRKFP